LRRLSEAKPSGDEAAEGGQWLIIHGRRDGNDLAAAGAVSDFAVAGLAFDPHPQLALWRCGASEPETLGSWALRSLTPCARSRSVGMPARRGAVSITRGALSPQAGQSDGASHSAIGLSSVNGPHAAQRYS
jgi:hypothetical protein